MKELSGGKRDLCKHLHITTDNFDVRTSQGQAALSFGLARPVKRGVFYDLDLIPMALVDAFATFLGRKTAADTIRVFWPKWLGALGRAETEQHRGSYFVVGKRDVPGKSNPPLFVSCGTLDEIQTKDLDNLPSEQRPTAVHGVDVWGLAEAVRDRAKKVGVMLGEPPFFLPATDPLYQQIIATGDALMVSLVDRYNKLQRMPVPLRKPPPEIIKIFEQMIMK